MDEDAPGFVAALIINVIIFIVTPLVLAYRRGYFFNISEHFNWIKSIFKNKNQYPAVVSATTHTTSSSKEKYSTARLNEWSKGG